MIIQFISAIGILLFATSLTSSSFEKICGNKIRTLINKFSNNRAKSSLFGMMMTLVMQSSTASVALVIGLASTGILTLFQSVAMIFGINIGSAITTIFVVFQGFNIVEYFGILILIGVFIRLFSNNKTAKNWGNCLVGVGLIFISLSLMSSATESFKTSSEFLNFFTSIDNPVLLLLIGTIFTCITNSSLGTMAILASLITTSGALTIHSAIFIIYGMNIGTCLTGIIIGTSSKNKDGIRASLAHLLFNTFGAIVFSLISIFDWVTPLFGGIPSALALVFVNIIFNVTTTLILIPLLKPFCKLLCKIIQNNKTRKKSSLTQEITQNNPTIAFIQLSNNADSMFEQLGKTLTKSVEFVFEKEESNKPKLQNQCTDLIQSSESMNEILLKIDSDSASDAITKKTLNDIFIGIKKTGKNIDKLLKSCMENDKKVTFNAKQQSMLESLKTLLLGNLLDIQIVFKESQNDSFTAQTKTRYDSIMERLQNILDIKVTAKKFVIQSNISAPQGVNKYSSFLNVINYFEEINTNLIDIALSIAKNIPEGNVPEQIDIDKYFNSMLN